MIKHDFLFNYLSIAAIMAPSLLVFFHAGGHSIFSSAVRVTIPISWRRCSNHRDILASGWPLLGWHSESSCVSSSIRHVYVTGSLNLTWAIICTVSVEQTYKTHFLVLTNNVAQTCVKPVGSAVCHKQNVPWHTLYNIHDLFFWHRITETLCANIRYRCLFIFRN
jgi:hypothetical protein